MKILMLNLPFAGHTNPTLPLARKLVDKGHVVTYINAEEMRERIEATGCSFVPYEDYPDHPSEEEKKKLSFKALYQTALNLKGDFDLLIYEMFFYPGIDVARLKDIPCVRQFSQAAWSDETWKDAPLSFKISAKLIDMQVLPKKTAKELKLSYDNLHDGIISSKPDLNIVYLPEAFQPHKEAFGPDYLFLVPENRKSTIQQPIPYEKMNKPLIYISLGSIISNKGFCKECLRAFGNTEFSVILNTGRIAVDSLGKIPANIYAYSFVPQIEVLAHTDVFLTHCGMNSINEALAAGVPMVAMPFINDQLTNAEQIVRLGLGKRVRSFPSSGRQLLRYARDVYKDPSYKEKTETMRRSIQKQISYDEVIERIEKLLT